MTNAQDNNGDWFDPETGELATDGEVTDIETGALVPIQSQTVMVNEAPKLISPNDMPDLDKMDEGFKLAAKYMEFEEKGQSMRGVFVGFTKMKSQNGDKLVDVANFQTKDGVWVNAGANLVYQFKDRGIPQGTPLQVTYLGKAETKSGNKVKTFEVRLLNAKPAPVIPDVGKGVPPMKSKQPA